VIGDARAVPFDLRIRHGILFVVAPAAARALTTPH